MKRPRIAGLRIVVFGLAYVSGAGLLVTWLWNTLMPVIFHLPAISFFQALGLLLLSRILLGRFGGFRDVRKARLAKGWHGLTPEERQRFRRAMSGARQSAEPS